MYGSMALSQNSYNCYEHFLNSKSLLQVSRKPQRNCAYQGVLRPFFSLMSVRTGACRVQADDVATWDLRNHNVMLQVPQKRSHESAQQRTLLCVSNPMPSRREYCSYYVHTTEVWYPNVRFLVAQPHQSAPNGMCCPTAEFVWIGLTYYCASSGEVDKCMQGLPGNEAYIRLR
jgi:hypothetical protein